MHRIRVGVLGITLALLALAACSEDLPAPTPPRPTPPRPTSQATFAKSVQVVGPAEVEPGGSAQFRAVASYPDGSTRDVTAHASWSSSRPSVLAVASGGVATGQSRGEATLRATFDSRTGSAELVVLPAGTFRLVVQVFAADSSERLSFVKVEVLSEDGTAIPGTSVGNTFSFYGARDETEVRTSQPVFFETDVQTIDVKAHQTLAVSLKRLDTPLLDVTGPYTLTITASSSCAATLPEEARTRTYTTTATQQRTGAVILALAGAQFESYRKAPGNLIDGQVVDVGRILFDLGDEEWVGWGGTSYVREVLPASDGIYQPSGLVNATIDEHGVSGPLDGAIRFSPRQGRSVWCRAKDHSFTMHRH